MQQRRNSEGCPNLHRESWWVMCGPQWFPTQLSGEFSFDVHVYHELKKKSSKNFMKEKKTVFYDYVDIDELSLLDLPEFYEKCSGKIKNPRFYWKAPSSESMLEISDDGDLLDMAATPNDRPRIIGLFSVGAYEVEDFLVVMWMKMQSAIRQKKPYFVVLPMKMMRTTMHTKKKMMIIIVTMRVILKWLALIMKMKM
ncbi:unnamed protein product [Linum trigynum]|uniref:PB1-like domain-containing protein n=1 Tax=Linum trigynum TaxID=586398 RepID=A0AAV2ER99_9ROSI